MSSGKKSIIKLSYCPLFAVLGSPRTPKWPSWGSPRKSHNLIQCPHCSHALDRKCFYFGGGNVFFFSQKTIVCCGFSPHMQTQRKNGFCSKFLKAMCFKWLFFKKFSGGRERCTQIWYLRFVFTRFPKTKKTREKMYRQKNWHSCEVSQKNSHSSLPSLWESILSIFSSIPKPLFGKTHIFCQMFLSVKKCVSKTFLVILKNTHCS